MPRTFACDGGIGIVGRLDSGSYEATIPGSYLGRRPGLQSAARRADDARPVRSRAFGLDAAGRDRGGQAQIRGGTRSDRQRWADLARM